MNMNKKRKILTVVALAVFGAIILFHYVNWKIIEYTSPYTDNYVRPGRGWVTFTNPGRPVHIDFDRPAIKDVRFPVFALAVFYAGLFSILGNKKD